MTPTQRVASHRDHHRERGATGGVEVLPFGLLLFVVGVLFIANVWAVIDAKLAVGAAAREGARAAVEAMDEPGARGVAHDVAIESLVAHGRGDARRIDVTTTMDAAFGRCTRLTVTVRYEVPAISLPWIGGLGDGIDATGTHSEVVDPYRNGLGARGCA